MPTEVKQFIGAMNLDDPNEVIGKGFHRTARNIRFKGNPPNLRPEVVSGNIRLVNSFLPASGTNLTIGREYDSINKRIFFFNYNSSGNHGIYILNTLTGVFQRLIQVGVNTIGDPLGFSANVIHNIDILYGDSTQGDILYYIDTQGRPTKVNINRALAGGYGNIQRSFIDVAKEPSDIPPYVVYEDDATATVNALRKKLFKIKVRWVFDDQDKSVTSSQSEVPLPYNANSTTTDSDPTKNCRIAIVYQTGPSNVRRVEILAALSLGNVFSDFFLIASIDKTAEAIPNNDVATYLFYNDKAYTYITVDESTQLFDYIPQTAQAQALLNGNVLGYGNIMEGYPNLTNFTNGSSTSNIQAAVSPYYYGRYFSLLVATQAGKTGFNSGNSTHIVVRGRVTAGNEYIIDYADGTQVEYEAIAGDDAADVIEGLRVDALSKGFTIDSVSSNDLYIFKVAVILAGFRLQPFVNVTTGENVQNQSLAAYDWWSKNGWALVYFDDKGRSNGAVYTNGFSVNSLPYSESNPPVDIPRMVASIYHRPPNWASYYQWVRTKDLTKSNLIQWVSDRTFKDTSSSLTGERFAYISIESLNQFTLKNPSSPLAYGFTPNDRIRFIKSYNYDFTTNTIFAQKDFEIISSEVNPTINGLVQLGQFIKIVLPTTDGTFDFGTGFNYYFIELYTPAQSVANGLNLYYEYGERYAIGNAGTSQAFHQGQLQNQTSNLVTPATFEFTKGGYYIRNRSIQTGNVYSFSVVPGGLDKDTILIGMTFDGSTYNDPNVTAQSVPYVPLSGSFNPATDTRWILRAIQPATFRIKGNIVFNFLESVPGDSWTLVLENSNDEVFTLVPAFDAANAGVQSFAIDSSISLTNQRLFLYAKSAVSQQRKVNFLTSNITFTIDRTVTQLCIDPNFSDYFASKVNSDGRAWVFNENANQVNFPVMMRWGGIYQEDTNVNNSNRFYPQEFASFNRSHGSLKAFGVYENMLTIFQERRTALTGIYSRYIQNNNNASELISTNTIITPNNYQYYAGNFGVGNQPDSIVQSGFVYYHVDPIKGKILRLSKDGYTDLGELYKAQTWAGENIPKYLNSLAYTYGGNARITGTFNIYPDKTGEYLLVAQPGTSGSVTQLGETLAFDEAKNSFTSFHDFAPECIICAENVLYMWRNGETWVVDDSTDVGFFFNTKYIASVSMVFNESAAIKKVMNAIAYQSNRTWAAPTLGDVETSTVNSQTGLAQQSSIMEEDFEILEMPNRYASFNRDQNSMSSPDDALWEGDYLCGTFVIVKLSYGGTAPSYLFSPYITWSPSPRNL